MKKVLATILGLAAVAFGQQAPMTAKIVSRSLTVTNTSDQDVLAFVVLYTSPKTGETYKAHDSYFKGHSLAPNETMDMTEHLDPNDGQLKSAEVVFVQWVDGTKWGDEGVAQFPGVPSLAVKRVAKKQFFQSASDAYQSGGESGFLAFLKLQRDMPLPQGKHEWQMFRGIAVDLLDIQQNSGTATAVAKVKDSLDAANSRNF